MTLGASTSRQGVWDARAAGNFICGGAGAGLIIFTALSGQQGLALSALLLAGVALVGTGLLCVWHELGRPLRALHVFFHPHTSWMSREAFVATLLVPAALLGAAGIGAFTFVAAALALAFVYCQSRMLQAARGVPAWREPLMAPLLVVTGLVEGGGLWLAATPWLRAGSEALLALFGALVLVRILIWFAYRRAIGLSAPRALAVLEDSGRVLQLAGTLLPLVAIALIAAGVVSGEVTLVVAAIAGIAATVGGSQMKYTLVVRAGFTQGFALVHLPVRGVRR